MSCVYITKHDENIYNLTEPEKRSKNNKIQNSDSNQSSRYVSKYHNKVIKKNWSCIDQSPNKKILSALPGSGLSYHKTMGYPHQPLKNPCFFLHKNEGIKWYKKKEHICYPVKPPIPIPKKADIVKKKPRSQKDMIQINIEKQKNIKVRQPIPKYVVTNRGDTNVLCKSGKLPGYIFSPTYGRLPKYLLRINKILCEQQKERKSINLKTQQLNKSLINYDMLANEERLKVIEGLKSNWIEKQLIFQKMPSVLDNIGQKVHRTAIEQDLRQLEKDIVLLEYNPIIYICD